MSTSPYHQAGKLMQQIMVERKSIKTIAFSSSGNSKNKLLCSKSTYAQVCNTIQHKSIIDSILNSNSSYLRKAIEMDKVRNQGLVYVLLYELLFGKYRSIRGGGKVKRSIMKFEKDLVEVRDRVVKDGNNTNGSGNGNGNRNNMPIFPRYVRVNKLKATTEEVVQLLKEEVKRQLLSKKESNGENDKIKNDDNNGSNINFDVYQDRHVPDLLVLPPKTSIQWHESELVNTGKVILQDKSSCFSALALVHGSNGLVKGENTIGDFIDATAAPGNKTLHLAALVYNVILKHKNLCSSTSTGAEVQLQQQQPRKKNKNKNKGSKRNNNDGNGNGNVKVFAFDRSSSRISILRDRVTDLAPSVMLNLGDDDNSNEIQNKRKTKMKAKDGNGNDGNCGNSSSFPVSICPIHQDFLKVDPADAKYKNVKSILLDPSCSGSGIVNSPDRIVDASSNGNGNGSTIRDSSEKNRIESLSNFQLVALKHAMSFPQCERIVYSTCSIHQMENEDVVAAALNETNEAMAGNVGDDDGMKWELVSPLALKHWKRRGLEVDGLTKEQSGCLIRVNGMDGDDTNGFFVSYFERKKIRSDERKEDQQQQEQQQPLHLVSEATGVKGIYNGQFAPASVPVDKSLKGSNQEEMEPSNSKNKQTDSKVQVQVLQQASTKSEKAEKEPKPIPKKAAKKLKWKQRQKELKLARLKKRKDASNVA